MTVKELAAGIALFAGAIAGGGSLLGWVDDRYMAAIRTGDLSNNIYHLDSQIIEYQGIRALYEARLQDNGELSPGDLSRYNTIIRKIDAAREAKVLLEQERAGL